MVAGCADDGGGDDGQSGKRGLPPIDPGGPMPNCGADEPNIVPVRERRWLAIDARDNADGPVGIYLVEITPDGAENLTRVAESNQSSYEGTWSADGRYFAYPRSDGAGWTSVDVFEVSQGAPPVAVRVPHQPGVVHWSPTDARFYVLPDETSDAPVLSLTDVASGTERFIQLSGPTHLHAWSPDGRYIAISGDAGVALIDTSGTELVTVDVAGSGSGGANWSPGGRYLAFSSGGTANAYGDLTYYDIETGGAEVVSSEASSSSWLSEGLLLWISRTRGYYLDLSREPLDPEALRGEQLRPSRAVPGGKCAVYDGYCGRQVSEHGLCVRSFPPDSSQVPVRIHDRGDFLGHWSRNGDHLAISVPSSDGSTLVHIPFDGSEFTREPINEPRHAQHHEVLWNPSGQSNWFGYLDESLKTDRHTEQRLWHRETRQTFVVDVGGRSSRRSTWSPDGRYLALEVTTDLGDQEPVLVLQEVLEDRLGSSFTLEGVISAVGYWEQPWQP
jgi:Tol biopolymer transport system component